MRVRKADIPDISPEGSQVLRLQLKSATVDRKLQTDLNYRRYTTAVMWKSQWIVTSGRRRTKIHKYQGLKE